MAATIFWVTVGFILYAYFGYALSTFFLSLVIRNPIKTDETFEPSVTFLITAYNEEKTLARKLENTLALDYPHDKLEILVASDGSTDGTDRIVADWSRRHRLIKLLRVEGRVGKTETQNHAVAGARGEIIIFSDATTEYRKDAIRKIVRNYADPTVGAVSGRYNYTSGEGSSMGLGTMLFWDYENFIKSCQTRIHTITGCCGCIYSVRRALYVPLRRDIISDLVEPLKIIEQGSRVAFEAEAIAYETATERASEEFGMRTRVITRGMNGLLHMRALLNPFTHGFVAFQLLSHKVLRWLTPLFMISLLTSNWFLLGHWFYDTVFSLQIGLYALAIIGWLAELRGGARSKLLSVPLYFCVINVASLVGLYNLLKGEKKIVWNTVRN